MFNDDQHTKRLFGTDTTMGLFVALYMILLAFFIMLNAVSEQKTSKAEVVMKGVNAAFSKETDDPSQPGEITPLPNDKLIPENDPLLIELSRSFGAEFDVDGRFSINNGLVYEIELPADRFFEKGSFQVRGDMEPFLERVVRTVLKKEPGENRTIVFMFGVGNNLVSKNLTRSQEFAVRRAGAIARFMKLHGMPDGMFHVGFVQIPEDKILAAFRNIPPVLLENGRVGP